nr:MAG TPA: Serine/threonine-protein phosphatase 2B catalytic subunit-hand, phosphatase, PxIxIT, LxVP, calcium [Caudoviricetes sp.]DAV95258.1 MAG TPA: Serine/threonine-protein phosphatase 2B catalytic subunit-hand, phosphatase, PxIxIT, LxVP, calcium [Caudoviricetes sp.]
MNKCRSMSYENSLIYRLNILCIDTIRKVLL